MRAGASFFYEPASLPFEAQEVRAYGLMLEDMVARMPADGGGHGGGHSARGNGSAAAKPVAEQLAALAADCCQPDVGRRPSFAAIVSRLRELSS